MSKTFGVFAVGATNRANCPETPKVLRPGTPLKMHWQYQSDRVPALRGICRNQKNVIGNVPVRCQITCGGGLGVKIIVMFAVKAIAVTRGRAIRICVIGVIAHAVKIIGAVPRAIRVGGGQLHAAHNMQQFVRCNLA